MIIDKLVCHLQCDYRKVLPWVGDHMCLCYTCELFVLQLLGQMVCSVVRWCVLESGDVCGGGVCVCESVCVSVSVCVVVCCVVVCVPVSRSNNDTNHSVVHCLLKLSRIRKLC